MLAKLAALVLSLLLLQLALCADDYYEVLGVQKAATEKQLKSAYRKLSKKFHPDKNPGDHTAKDKFVAVSEAYEVLSDTELRKVYDRHGHEGVKRRRDGQGGGAGHHDPMDLFSRFFGGHGHFGSAHAEPRGHNVEVRVEIPLRDFYTGATTDFTWERQHICEACEGTGSRDRVVDTCPVCDGRGVRLVKQQLAPGMFQQLQLRCDACAGRGRTVRHPCPVCAGRRVEKKATTVSLPVAPGAARDSRVVFENEADESPDWVAGDLLVTLVEKPPPAAAAHDAEANPDRVDGVFFRRRGDHLYWTEVLSLREAWMGGWSRNLTHLDRHVVRLGRPRGHVVQSGHVDTVVGEGMPVWHEHGDSPYHKTEFGNLYVTYEVVLPDQMDPAMAAEFSALWDKWHAANGVPLRQHDSDRLAHDEL